MSKLYNYVSNMVVDLDAFGQPITLNFDGKDTFKTGQGGILSIIIYSLFFWQSWELVRQLYSQEDPSRANYDIGFRAEELMDLTENR